MASPVKYYTFSAASTIRPIDGSLKDVDASNPIFNFDPEFLPKLQGVTPLELAQSVPYISLHTIDLDGKIIEDLNVNYFFKTTDLSQLNSGLRYKDRPAMSLIDLELRTDLASGYLYYTEVKLRFKIHAPDALGSSTLTSILIPNMPLLLEYGWNSPNEFLNQKERLLFQVITYNINMDETGQMEVTVDGKALNEGLNNLYVGDLGDPINTDLISDEEAEGVNRSKVKIQTATTFLNSVKQQPGQNSNDYALTKSMATSYKNVQNIVRDYITSNFKSAMESLSAPNLKTTKKKQDYVKFHDLVHVLCNDTLVAATDMWPRVGEFRVIYGDLNESITGVPRSIADFPIHLGKFKSLIKDEAQRGQTVITVKKLLELLTSKFIKNEEYFKSLLSDNDARSFTMPNVVLNFSNRSGGPNNEGVMELTITDLRFGIPPTLKHLPNGPSSQDKAKSGVVAASAYHLPTIEVGHANSFLKKMSLQQVTDPAMKAVLIARMSQDRVANVRSTDVKPSAAKPVTPLTLPVQGTLEVLGHKEWKPFRSFWLSVGNFVIDGVYKIGGVTHRLNAGGFNTTLEIRYN